MSQPIQAAREVADKEPAAFGALLTGFLSKVVTAVVILNIWAGTGDQVAIIKDLIDGAAAIVLWVYVRRRVTPNATVGRLVEAAKSQQATDTTAEIHNFLNNPKG